MLEWTKTFYHYECKAGMAHIRIGVNPYGLESKWYWDVNEQKDRFLGDAQDAMGWADSLEAAQEQSVQAARELNFKLSDKYRQMSLDCINWSDYPRVALPDAARQQRLP